MLGDLLGFYSQDYDNKIILGDFNLESSNRSIASFMNNQNLFNQVKSNTCFKGEGSCFDLILTNRKHSFKNTCSFETGLRDHHHLIYSVMKTTVKSEEPKQLIYRDYSNFSCECFKDDFMSSKNMITQISRKSLQPHLINMHQKKLRHSEAIKNLI